MKSFVKKDLLLKKREVALKKNLKKRRNYKLLNKQKNASTFRQMG